MSQARPVYPGKTVMVTKRVHKRQLLLDADPMVMQIVKYTVAYCAQKHNVDLHCLVTEGNHVHQVPTTHQPNLPDFYRDVHSFIARQVNIYYGEHDSFWSGSQTNVVVNEDAEDIVERIVYAMGNPVADGIERHGADHKGIRLRWPRQPEVIERPPLFWRPEEVGGTAPKTVILEFKRPPGFDALSGAELDQMLEERILAYEKEKREARDAAGLPFLCDSPQSKVDPKSFPRSKPVLSHPGL